MVNITKQTLILVRGAPGSGKSTLAKKLSGKLVEADMFFIQANGDYTYRPDLIKSAHQWCQSETKKLLNQGFDVIVANTFIKKWELQFYLDLAQELKLELKVIEAKGRYQNIHGVPETIVKQMRNNFEIL